MNGNEKPAAGPPQQRIQIELPEREAEGIYSNLVFINNNAAEFVFDFARVLPGVQKAKIYARVVMVPIHAKALLEALERNVKAYEDKNGKIKAPGMPDEKEIGF
jgi:hypothetical protein